jgi:hypothetical protein
VPQKTSVNVAAAIAAVHARRKKAGELLGLLEVLPTRDEALRAIEDALRDAAFEGLEGEKRRRGEEETP